MSQGKQLPPVASDPITTLLTSRFCDPPDEQPQSPDPSTTDRPARMRREPAGMTRQTIYVPRGTADLLNTAATRVQAATGGRISKHEALTAIIAAGVEQADTAVAKVREALLRDLQGKSG